jgi:hypothetical protein
LAQLSLYSAGPSAATLPVLTNINAISKAACLHPVFMIAFL